MAKKDEVNEEIRQAREAGWRSEHFRYRVDQLNNIHVARAEFVGPEALTFNLWHLPELLDELSGLKDQVPDEKPFGEPTDPLYSDAPDQQEPTD